jgi:hypothetical protein
MRTHHNYFYISLPPSQWKAKTQILTLTISEVYYVIGSVSLQENNFPDKYSIFLGSDWSKSDHRYN